MEFLTVVFGRGNPTLSCGILYPSLLSLVYFLLLRPAETFVWARPSHSSRDSSLRPRVNWFPGMVIAASYATCLNRTAGLSPEVVLSNLSRIPADLQAELLKIRFCTSLTAVDTGVTHDFFADRGPYTPRQRRKRR